MMFKVILVYLNTFKDQLNSLNQQSQFLQKKKQPLLINFNISNQQVLPINIFKKTSKQTGHLPRHPQTSSFTKDSNTIFIYNKNFKTSHLNSYIIYYIIMFGNINSTQPNLNQQSQSIPHQPSTEECDLQAKRQGMTISIRKQGRENEILKRRKQNATAVISNQDQTQPLNPFEEKLRQFKQKSFDVGQLHELTQCMYSGDLEKAHYGIIGIRKILSSQKQPPIQMIIDANLVPKIIQFAKQSQYSELQAESTWCLSNIASGTSLQTQSVIDKGGIQLFVELLKSNNEVVVQQAVWAIGNIAGDRTIYRDNLIKFKVLDILGKLIQKSQNIKIVAQGSWAVSNILRTNPIPKFQVVKPVIPILAGMIMQGRVTDVSVIADTLWALSYVVENHNNRINSLMQTGIAPKLIQLLGSGIPEVVSPSLRTLGNICYGNELHIETLLNGGILHRLEALMNHKKKVIRREVCWTISNIAASIDKHVNLLFSHQSIIQKLYSILSSSQIPEIKVEAGYVFVNAAEQGNAEFLTGFYHQHKFVNIFLNFVTSNDASHTLMGLKGINACLKVGEETKSKTGGKSVLMNDLWDNNGVDVLQQAQLHKDNKVYQVALKILTTYFEAQNPLD